MTKLSGVFRSSSEALQIMDSLSSSAESSSTKRSRIAWTNRIMPKAVRHGPRVSEATGTLSRTAPTPKIAMGSRKSGLSCSTSHFGHQQRTTVVSILGSNNAQPRASTLRVVGAVGNWRAPATAKTNHHILQVEGVTTRIARDDGCFFERGGRTMKTSSYAGLRDELAGSPAWS